MNNWDFLVLFGSLAGIAIFGIWRTRGRRSLSTYLKGNQTTGWVVVGISVMATQASATTFISGTGQGFQDGLGFVQNYFGLPLAMIVIAVFFLPMYKGLNVYTAYEYLGRRFDGKTRLLSAGIFLAQRGLNAGFTIYAPAIVLSTVLGWSLDATIIISGLVVTIYTVAGGSEAVTITQKYQMGVIFGGMMTAFIILLTKLPAWLTFDDALDGRGRLRQDAGRGLFARPGNALYALVGSLRRRLSDAGLFRHRPVASAALHRRRLAARKPARTDVQCGAARFPCSFSSCWLASWSLSSTSS